ncbi:MAG: glycoside-pentoside-hexuronide (GPH):cation symporter [bacterium]|nr:glycoside-pentoside-hexuronide (GPH):cation symporter [bacterium]MDY5458118.1 glycoside-pentoside-hexuronide (GPH):cation symporter [Bariatricus sp.]
MSKEKQIRPFGWRDKVGYLIGNLGNDFTFTFASVFLMVFYTKVLGISPGLVGTLFVVARVVDAFTDVTMGRIADKAKPAKDGKFKPWLRRMCGPVALASFLMYQTSMANAPMTLRIVYMFATYLLWGSIFYTAINIPYGSMASLISPEADDRAALSTFRSLGSVVANIAVGIGAPAILYASDTAGNQIVKGELFPIVALVFSILSIASYLVCYFMTTERVKAAPAENVKQVGFLETVRTLVTNRALIGIVVASICILAAQILNQSINQYLFIDYFKDKSGVMVMNAVSMLPGIILAPVAVPLSRKFGKKELGIFGSLSGAIACFLLFIMRTKSMWAYIIINVIGFLGFGVFNLIMWAFITDIIDDQEIRTGSREDGTVYAVYSFARKLGQAVAGGLGGWALGWIGFDSAAQVQTEAVVQGIYNIATLIPAVLYLIVGLSLIFIYPLGKKKVLENIEILKAKQSAN